MGAVKVKVDKGFSDIHIQSAVPQKQQCTQNRKDDIVEVVTEEIHPDPSDPDPETIAHYCHWNNDV